jgi:large subunit ribosomal protein L6
MSRIGRKIIPIPAGVEVKVSDRTVAVKGPLGRLEWTLNPPISVTTVDGHVQVNRANEQTHTKALHGLTRAELQNMIVGVTKGYERTLEVTGVGYKAAVQGQKLSFNVGYTHPVEFPLPKGVEAKVDKQTIITVKGIDKRMVGQTAANLRAIKPPDVYKQKGIRYQGEQLRKKEGKTGK